MSRKFPKLPGGAKNPFERALEDGLRVRGLRAEEVKPQETVGGCGDKNCPMCYPNGRPENGDYRKSGRPNMAFNNREEEEYRRVREEMIRMGPGPVMMEYIPTPPASSAAYNAAREEVEEWIIEAPADTSWSDVIGNDAAREALIDAIETPLKHGELYAHYSMSPPKGVLLWGPPGNGKTMFAKAAAGAIARHYGKAAELLLINGATLQSPWLGETEEKIVAMFAYAKEYKKKHGFPLTIFIDEADAILPPRSTAPSYAVKNVSTFLGEMDGLVESAAFVILATNRPEEIDEALLRDGRCDRKIKIERPTYDVAREIVQKALLKVPCHQHDLDRPGGHGWLAKAALDYFVQPEHHIITGYRQHPDGSTEELRMTLSHLISGAMMVGLVTRAKIVAFHRDLKAGTVTGITESDMLEAVRQVAKENVGLRHEWALRDMIEELDKRQNVKTSFTTTTLN